MKKFFKGLGYIFLGLFIMGVIGNIISPEEVTNEKEEKAELEEVKVETTKEKKEVKQESQISDDLKDTLVRSISDGFDRDEVATRDISAEKIAQKIEPGESGSTEIVYEAFIRRIARLRENNRVSDDAINIFTTNYDLYSENALDELGIMYNNGFLGSAQRIFNPNSYNYVVVENLGLSRDVWKSVSNFINLYKIHGSINWLKDDNSGSDTPHILEKDIELIRSRKKYDSIMIYPTPQKDRTTLMVPYSDLFRMMQNSLLKKNSVLISLGYSFGDEHINRIILNALSVYDFRLVIFGDSDMIRKLQEIGDNRIWIINSEDNIHYFNNFVERVLPTQDEEQREEIEIKKSLKKLAVVLGDSSEDPK